jgi:serine/threonine-protein kinase
MAQVLEAMACGLDGFERRVAIKRLLPQHARSGERRRMFFEEARIGSRLHHGGIVPIFDYGVIDGSEFLAMDFVDGLDALRAVTSASNDVEPMPEGIALHIASEVAHALAYVHDLRDDESRALGIVHRDVSPANILLSWDGDVKLCDFGIAFSGLRSRDEQTMGGAVKGKLHYMAPEQARGERVSTAADVYALGATLDALMGGGALAPVRSDSSGDARAAAARRRGLSEPVSDLIRGCLSCDPARRPAAGELATQAGALASQRLGRDGRSALVEWLRPLRALSLRASKLDDLMGLCLVSVGPPEARSLTVTALREASAPSSTDGRRFPAARRRMSAVIFSTALIATAVAVGLGAGRFINQLRGKGAIAAPLVSTAPVPAPAAPPVLMPPAVLAPPAAPAVPPALARPEGPRAAMPARAPEVPPHVHHAAVAHSEGPGAFAHPDARGWLRVGGATLAGARVTIDHAGAGFAPLELELPTGVHSVVVTAPGSGHVLVHTTIRISADRTRIEPVRILR